MATSALEVDAVPSVDLDAIPVDASPLTLNENTCQQVHKLDPILDKLTIADYRSMFFLLIDDHLEKQDFLFWVMQVEKILRTKFLNIYFKFSSKDALLIEIFGTMQRYDLLKMLKTCCHVYEKDKETFTQLSPRWKFLYAVCEQLSDGEVDYLKENLFPEDTSINVCCAEELICLSFLKGKLDEGNYRSKLEEIFVSSLPDCSKFISSYKVSNLRYYPLRRPTKKVPCGIAVIMNHVKFDGKFKDRPESDTDANALKKLWESFGFKTEIHTDFTAEQVNQLFVKLSKEDHSNHDAFVACYLSHGAEGGIVFAKDGKPIVLADLIDLIANNCRTLVGKPKLFFVQACQGQVIQTGVGGPTLTPPVRIQHPIPTTRHSKNVAIRSDVVLFNSSIEGFASFRQGNSSWFIDALVTNLEKYGEELTLTNILTKVNNDVQEKEGALNDSFTKCKQTPIYNNTLKHEVKLKKVM